MLEGKYSDLTAFPVPVYYDHDPSELLRISVSVGFMPFSEHPDFLTLHPSLPIALWRDLIGRGAS